MEYIIIFALLFAFELLYFRIANNYRIIDKPNERSSHTKAAIRGGGIIYWIVALFYLVSNFNTQSMWFFAGITLISVVSFVDDMVSLSQRLRLFIHLLVMTCAFILANVFNIYSWWTILIGYIVFIGIVNAYNFMDGINGISGLYSIAVLGSLQYVNLHITPFVTPDLIWYPIIASLVFLYFNFRKQAVCFAGDVGSIGIAFWIVTLLLLLIIKTHDLVWLGFLMVYGVDTVCTILHRIYLNQNILEAHRLHFYQILANEKKVQHRVVSIGYFFTQLIVSSLIIFLYPLFGWWVFIVTLVVLLGIYMLKFRLMRT